MERWCMGGKPINHDICAVSLTLTHEIYLGT